MSEKRITILSQIKSLKEHQKKALLAIMKKLQSGKMLAQKDLGMMGIEYNAVPRGELAKIFKVKDRTTYEWDKKGCPKNPDGSYDIYMVNQWMIEQKTSKLTSTNDLDKQKKQAEIDWKNAQIDKLHEKYIPRELANNIEISRCSALNRFLEYSMPAQAAKFTGLSMDEATVKLSALGKAISEAYSGEKA